MRPAGTGPGSHSNSRSGGEFLFWARNYLAQAREARLSENAWELEACRCSCSLGEEPHLWARGGLAQARRASLSEKSQKPLFHCSSPRLSEKRLAWAQWCGCLLAWLKCFTRKVWWMMPWLLYEVEMRTRCCFIVYELGSMSCMIGCLYTYTYRHDIGIYGNFLIDWWNMCKVWVGRNSMTLVVRAHGGASSNGHNPMDPPSESPWWCFIYWT